MPLPEIPQAPKPEIPDWLQEVAIIPGEFPMEKMREVWARGEEVEDVLVAYLEWLAGPERPGRSIPDHDWLHFIAFYLLSDRASPRLFDPLVRITYDDDYSAELLGDSETENLPGWLRVSGKGRVDELLEIVEDRAASEWLRVAALNALGGMAWEGSIPKEDHMTYLRHLPDVLTPGLGFLWGEWLMHVVDFGLRDQLERIAEFERKGYLDSSMGGAEMAREGFDNPEREKYAEKNLLFKRPGGTTGLEELSKFYCFTPGYREALEREERLERRELPRIYHDDPYIPSAPVQQVIRPEPKIGRNDPCPCGSGKKWKKCCGANSAEG